MISAKANALSRGSNLRLNAAVGTGRNETSHMQGPNPLHYLLRHGWAYAPIMDDPAPATEFGSYEN